MEAPVTQLTEHFSLEELTATSHREIDNTPPIDAVTRLGCTARGLEHVRLLLGVPVIVLSGYRCPALNCIVGGAMTEKSILAMLYATPYEPVVSVARQRLISHNLQKDDSQHMGGEACDFVAPRFGTPYEICKAIEASDLRFDQLIYEGGANGWVHVSFIDYNTPRRSVLTWKKGQGYEPGIKGLGD